MKTTKHHIYIYIYIYIEKYSAFLCTFLTVISALVLANTVSSVYAEDSVVTTTAITISESCSMTGTVNTPHNASVINGTYSGTSYPNGIGQTTLKAFCNDSAGFAIYAIGYTGNEYGNTKLHSDTLGSTYDINTDIYNSGSASSSTWSMKLTSVSGTYAPTIADGTNGLENFTTWHVVPSTYTKVAYRTSGTDVDNSGSGIGSSLTTTYDAYVSATQPAGTYVGQVKYTLVHPSNAAEPVPTDQVGVQFNGNGLTFAGGATTNRVNYRQVCGPMYISQEDPEIATSSNFDEYGEFQDSYSYDEETIVPITIEGAKKLWVNIDWGIDSGTSIMIVQGNWDSFEETPTSYYEKIDGQSDGSDRYIISGNTVTFMIKNTDGLAPASGYDLGFYAEVYPMYTTEEEGTELIEDEEFCWNVTAKGTYAETTTWNGKWYMIDNGDYIYFNNEAAILNYIESSEDPLTGNIIEVYAYNPYIVSYNGNGATTGTMQGFTTKSNSGNADLLAPNFLRTGYGFAGWSENSNATVNGDDVIYGPNENIDIQDLTLSGRTATLYAVWVQSSGNMQTWEGCSSLSVGQVIALTDARDSSVYTVSKHADNRCWMMENLRLPPSTSSLGPANTNIFNTEVIEAGQSVYITSLPQSSPLGLSWICILNQVNCINTTRVNGSNTNASNNPNPEPPVKDLFDDQEYQWYSYGNYYNWTLATAGIGKYSTTTGFVNMSICPTNWRLPSGGGTDTMFYRLQQAIGTSISKWREYPNNFVYSGALNGLSFGGRGSSISLWSSSAFNQTQAYALANGSFTATNKSYGLPIRCVYGASSNHAQTDS